MLGWTQSGFNGFSLFYTSLCALSDAMLRENTTGGPSVAGEWSLVGPLGSMASSPGTAKRELGTSSVQGRCSFQFWGCSGGRRCFGSFLSPPPWLGWREWGAGVASGSTLRLSGAQVGPAVGRLWTVLFWSSLPLWLVIHFSPSYMPLQLFPGPQPDLLIHQQAL